MNRKGILMSDANVVEIARNVKPAIKGVLEITDVNRIHRQYGQLNVEVMGRGMAWLDTGTHDSLLEASQLVATLEKRQGRKVACLEEIAWLTDAQLEARAHQFGNSRYGEYLKSLLAETVITRSKR